MPELPEAETVRRQLEKEVVGRRIGSVSVNFAKRLNVSAAEFSRSLSGRRVNSVSRRAKIILFGLSGGRTLAVHLKMTGRLLALKKGSPCGKHTHVVLGLSGGKELHFDDMRKFGYMRLLRSDEVESCFLAPLKFGPEPLGEDFRLDDFGACLKRRRRAAIKPLLMSQTCVAGLGNIYADEVCWLSRIRPGRRAGSLSRAEVGSLYDAIRLVLRKAVSLGGSSVDDYRDAYGKRGGYAARLQAYGRTGQPCSRCGKPIRKTRFGGRGTHYCGECQK